MPGIASPNYGSGVSAPPAAIVAPVPLSSPAAAAATFDDPIKRIQDMQLKLAQQLQQLQTRSSEDQMRCVAEQQVLLAALQRNPADTSVHAQLAVLMQQQQEKHASFTAFQQSAQAQQLSLAEMLNAAIQQQFQQVVQLPAPAPSPIAMFPGFMAAGQQSQQSPPPQWQAQAQAQPQQQVQNLASPSSPSSITPAQQQLLDIARRRKELEMAIAAKKK
jgi:hypothetical protein